MLPGSAVQTSSGACRLTCLCCALIMLGAVAVLLQCKEKQVLIGLLGSMPSPERWGRVKQMQTAKGCSALLKDQDWDPAYCWVSAPPPTLCLPIHLITNVYTGKRCVYYLLSRSSKLENLHHVLAVSTVAFSPLQRAPVNGKKMPMSDKLNYLIDRSLIIFNSETAPFTQ